MVVVNDVNKQIFCKLIMNDYFIITENSPAFIKTTFPCEYPVQFAVFVAFQPKLKP